MVWMTIDQFLAIGMKCSHCEKKATWLAHTESPAYCDEHFPYWDINRSVISVDDDEEIDGAM
jgi:hypothetical protein